jgi:hypothetical protein
VRDYNLHEQLVYRIKVKVQPAAADVTRVDNILHRNGGETLLNEDLLCVRQN